MFDIIDEIILTKPHLADPFRFYKKTLEFREAVKKYRLHAWAGETAYPPEAIGQVFERLGTLLELPEGTLGPLKQAMELHEIDFTRLPLGEVPAFSLPYAPDDLAMLLFILSKPWFLARRDSIRLDDRTWEEAHCPVCHAQPLLCWTDGDKRRAVCSFCGTEGYVNRTGCPVCARVDPLKQNVLAFEGEEGIRMETCDLCGSYIKTADSSFMSRFSPEIADLMSLPLDIIVQEKGYVRRSPNPIGMRTISARG